MNILELDSFNLADAVKFNDKLNSRIWQGQKMRPEVRKKLLEIAEDFREFLGVDNLDVKDITVSGSNASYHYTPYSDIDLHLVVDVPKLNDDAVFRELFDAKKYQYNDLHNIKIGGYDVELYVEDAGKPPVSQGIFSVKNNDWINIPKKRRATVDDTSVKSKYEDIKHRIESALKDKDFERINTLAKKIKAYRQAGLDSHGEFGPENIAFKMLRNQGYIGKLYDARNAARDAELSLAEQNKVKKPFVYGYKSVAEDATATPDGVNPTTQMFLNEKETPTQEEIIRDFLNFVVEKLNIDTVPKLRLKKDPAWSIRNKSFGRYDNATGELIVALGNRHIMDILRTLAHELTHRKQDEREDMPPDAGETGSSYENEANAQAGVLMRDYAAMHPEYFKDVAVNESSGYIPTRAQANDPRFKMALTVDVYPGQTGKEANKMALKTDKKGKPALLIKSANMIGEAARSYGYNSKPLSQVPGEREDELGNQEATGPEFEPQFPAGTTKVDVTDLTDWYRLGMDISDLDDADPEDYNQGPPQTVITFPSDEAEQGYLKQFKRLGLKTHDLDPDVEGGEDVTGKHLNKALAEELEAFKAQDLFEVKMTSKNLAKLAQDIKGAKVGLEFEMIVPNVSNDENSDLEPDYDQDERVRDIDDAVNFFDDGDYNGRNEIRRLREQMESDYFDWQTEQIDQEWDRNGFEFFQEYLDREEPFDPEDYQERAEDEIKAEFPDMDPTSEDFGELVAEKLREINSEYYVETWEAQGRSYDYAREEFEEEQRDNYSENAWLDDQNIRYASDVESNYGNVTWPYYTSTSDSEGDIESVALDFMNAMGMDSVAISSSYHGPYKKWAGNGWVSAGNSKPDDCFTIEPDGSLEGDDSSDTGLEFVSPPIPLEDIGTVMSKVQNWAGNYGAYTGDQNKTSIHTNISIPGYDLDKLDYLKAALLLGDEYVLREFDRIGNTYAAPAIEKVRALVKQKPEKAQELLDKMKSQLNAEASKLIHSGQTNKFTSINTKDNRVEFRSPGGDYLSIIADNPQKMVDTINRMVVTLDAAMDPNKYKEEYQKKLYKMLTGQESGREAKSGAKREMKKDDKDLLNIFSRYAAGELPKAALKSFVRQAQLERKGKKADAALASHNWAIRRGFGGDIVRTFRADDYNQAFEVLQQYKRDHNITDDSLTYGKYDPSEETPQQPSGPQWGVWDNDENRFVDRFGGTSEEPVMHPSEQAALVWANRAGQQWRLDNDQVEVRRAPQAQLAQQGMTLGGRPTNPDGNWVIANRNALTTPVYRFMAADMDDALQVLNQWRAEYPNEQWLTNPDRDRRLGQPATQQQGNWGIWINANDRFANQPGEYARGATVPLYRFPSREAAEQWIEQQRAERPNMRSDIEVREIEPAEPIPGSTLDLQRQRAAQQPESEPPRYEMYRISDGRTVEANGMPIQFVALNPEDAERKLRIYAASHNLGAPELFAVRSVLQLPAQQTDVNPLRPTGPGPWEVASRANNQVYYNTGHTQRAAAETEARTWLTQNGHNPADFEVRTREGVRSTDAEQGGLVDVAGEQPATAPQTLTRPGQGQQVFTGDWKVLINGEQVYQFRGIGNNQGDANRVGRDWVLQQIRQGTLNPANGADIEVLPVMGEA